MAKPKKKKSSAKKSAARKTRSARKIARPSRKLAAKRPASKKVLRASAKVAKRSAKSPKSKRKTDLTGDPLKLMGNNHQRERRLDPFTRKQKEKLLQLRDAMVDSMAGVARTLFARVQKGARPRLLVCIRPTLDRMLTIAILR